MATVRLQITDDLEKIFKKLEARYELMSRAEIMKLALSELYEKTKNSDDDSDTNIYMEENIEINNVVSEPKRDIDYSVGVEVEEGDEDEEVDSYMNKTLRKKSDFIEYYTYLLENAKTEREKRQARMLLEDAQSRMKDGEEYFLKIVGKDYFSEKQWEEIKEAKREIAEGKCFYAKNIDELLHDLKN